MTHSKKRKTIVVCSDGTGNVGGSTTPTNVWRIRQAIKKRNSAGELQVLIFQDGVGTSRFLPLQILGKALSLGITPNLESLYSQLIQAYRPGDRIFFFGFSRGAFTIRVLANLCNQCGLANCRDENGKLYTPSEITMLARRAVQAYKQRHVIVECDQTVADKFRQRYGLREDAIPVNDPSLTKLREKLSEETGRVPIEFIGVWDTVASVGLPFENMTQATMKFWRWITSRSRALRWAHFAQLNLSRPTDQSWRHWEDDLHDDIQQAFHALSVDDERQAFKPVLWIEQKEELDDMRRPTGKIVRKQNVQQVWFAGMHANVGGGYGKDNLAYVSLSWMMRHAHNAGLDFEESSLAEVADAMDELGIMGDSRSGLGMYYRYQPRLIAELSEEVGLVDPSLESTSSSWPKESAWKPKIHDSVFRRIEFSSESYSPIGIPRFGCYDSIDHTPLRPDQDRSRSPKAMTSETVVEANVDGDRGSDSVEVHWAKQRHVNTDQSVEQLRMDTQRITRGYIHLRRFLHYAFFALTVLFVVVGFLEYNPSWFGRIERACYAVLGVAVDGLIPIPPIVTVVGMPFIFFVIVVSASSFFTADRAYGGRPTDDETRWGIGRIRSTLGNLSLPISSLTFIVRGLAVFLLAIIIRPLVNSLAQFLLPSNLSNLVGVLASPTWFGLFAFIGFLCLHLNQYARERMTQWNRMAWTALQGVGEVRQLEMSPFDRLARSLKADSRIAACFDRFVVPLFATFVLSAVLSYPIWTLVSDVLIRVRVSDSLGTSARSDTTTLSSTGRGPSNLSMVEQEPARFRLQANRLLETGLSLRQGEVYVVETEQRTDDQPWSDGGSTFWDGPKIPAGADGFDDDQIALSWAARSFKRERDVPWFHLCGCLGDPTAPVFAIESGVPFTANDDGVLYLMVNDLPGFYFNNRGSATVMVRRMQSRLGSPDDGLTFEIMPSP
ncbi:MAG: DUF2235 domain-containing protein [Planctomycetota bacterium]